MNQLQFMAGALDPALFFELATGMKPDPWQVAVLRGHTLLTMEERKAGLLRLWASFEEKLTEGQRQKGEPVSPSRLPQLQALPAEDVVEWFRRIVAQIREREKSNGTRP